MPGPADSAETKFVAVRGARIAYRDFGSGVPILFLHRYRASMDDWDPALLNAVAARGRRVIILDNFGVGQSQGEVPDTLAGAADDLAAIAQALGLPSADVIGWSMGGMTAQILAAKHPQLVRRLVLAGTTPPVVADGLVTNPPEWTAVAGKQLYSREDQLFLFFGPSELGRSAGLTSLDRSSSRRPVTDMKVGDGASRRQLGAIRAFLDDRAGWYDKLRFIRHPTLVVNGDRDRAFPQICSEVLAREIPDAQLTIYPDSGHGFQHQYPERFAGDLVNFLSS